MPDAAPSSRSTEDPRWESVRPATGARRALSREAIVEAAVRLADEHGLHAVSMPRLARTLGSAPMSLYRHVPHKDALIELMLDSAVGEPPDVGDDVAAGLRIWARANRAIFVAHPWTLPLVSSPRRMGPAECRWAETVLRLLVDDGVTAIDALQILHVVNSYVRGASVPAYDRAPQPEDIERSGWAAELPLFTALLRASPEGPPEPDGGDPMFEAGLTQVLDGAGAHLDTLRGR